MTLAFLLWIVFVIHGAHVTLEVHDIGQGVAAWCASVVCGVAAFRASAGRVTWALFAASSFAWGAGEVVWCYYALIKNVPVPFPSLADVGFLTAVPLAFAGLLRYPMGPRRPAARVQEFLDGCIIATSLLFASWATILAPLYRSHQGGALKQVISLAYPTSDVIMVSLVIILIARAGRTGRIRLGLVMAGVVAFAVSDSAFSYLTEVNSYNGGSFLDTGWVAGYLLIALGAPVGVNVTCARAVRGRGVGDLAGSSVRARARCVGRDCHRTPTRSSARDRRLVHGLRPGRSCRRSRGVAPFGPHRQRDV